MITIQHIDQLLKLQDAAFVEAAYQVLLGRSPEPEGFRFYLGHLRTGISKAKIITLIAESVEAKAYGINLAGLNELKASVYDAKLIEQAVQHEGVRDISVMKSTQDAQISIDTSSSGRSMPKPSTILSPSQPSRKERSLAKAKRKKKR